MIIHSKRIKRVFDIRFLTILLFVATITLLLVPPAVAADGSDKKLENKIENKCHSIFLELWRKSKDGDLKSRLEMLAYMTMFHGPYLTLPNASHDYLIKKRSIIILAVHSIGLDLGNDENYKLDTFYSNVNGLGKDSKFGKCLAKNRSQECVSIAEKEGVVPSFNNFSKEIDIFIKAGYKAECYGSDYFLKMPIVTKEIK